MNKIFLERFIGLGNCNDRKWFFDSISASHVCQTFLQTHKFSARKKRKDNRTRNKENKVARWKRTEKKKNRNDIGETSSSSQT
jgi:hypothetical protein